MEVAEALSLVSATPHKGAGEVVRVAYGQGSTLAQAAGILSWSPRSQPSSMGTPPTAWVGAGIRAIYGVLAMLELRTRHRRVARDQ